MTKTITIQSSYSGDPAVTLTAEQMLDSLNACAKDERGNPLPCHGCAHSRGSENFPNGPSGERPCCFCVRNVRREKWVEEMSKSDPSFLEAYGKTWTCFYNNAPMKKAPMDCYISTDRVLNDVPESSAAFG